MANNKNWSQIGDEIEDMVRSALESKDFGRLNEVIARTADEALDNVERSVQKAMDKAHEKVQRKTGSYGSAANRRYTPGNTGSRYRDDGYDPGEFKDAPPSGTGTREKGSGRSTFRDYGTRQTTVYRRSSEHESVIKSTRFKPGYERARENNGTQLLRERFRNTAPMNSAGIVFTACGYSFLGILLLVWFIILAATMPESLGVAATTTAIMAPFIAGSAFMAYKGTSLLSRTKRFRRYVETLREREFCQIEELAESLGKSESFVKKDLSRMIQKRLFLHGHLDRQKTCLMVTEDAYQQYQIAEKQLEVRQKEQQQKAEEAEKLGQRKDLPEEAKKVIAAGKEYLTEIQRCNDRIPGEEVSEKISHLELVISKIFNRVEQHPELVDDLGRFMDYYLPTTVKLLKAYEELDGQPVQGDNIKTSKKEIEDTLDTIGKAFENLLDSFFEEAAWDISSDISVLHNMFAQEGLTESEFDKIKVR